MKGLQMFNWSAARFRSAATRRRFRSPRLVAAIRHRAWLR